MGEHAPFMGENYDSMFLQNAGTTQLIWDGTQQCMGGEVKGNVEKGVGIQ